MLSGAQFAKLGEEFRGNDQALSLVTGGRDLIQWLLPWQPGGPVQPGEFMRPILGISLAQLRAHGGVLSRSDGGHVGLMILEQLQHQRRDRAPVEDERIEASENNMLVIRQMEQGQVPGSMLETEECVGIVVAMQLEPFLRRAG